MNKNRGFTLIELLVVISIISLLSSVVLASVKDARQKADNTRIVSEMKSLQVALELYKARFGTYPNAVVDEGLADQQCAFMCGGFNSFVKTYLVDNKLIGKVPQSKGYPNNCINSCYDGNMFFYLDSNWTSPYYDPNFEFYYVCGGQKVTSSGYVLGYLTKEKLSLPKFTSYTRDYQNVYLATGVFGNDVNSPYVYEYCLSI